MKDEKTRNSDTYPIQKGPLISIMVAVYNAENYVSKCIESIMNQTYQNLEIILVNDGSTDKSGLICEEYKQKDKRIKVCHKENKGLSDTRNVGLRLANGEYLGFVDSDDWILPDMYEKLINLSLKFEADMVHCQSFSDLKELNKRDQEIEILEKNEFMPKILTDNINSQVWKNIYKKELFDEISFPKDYSVQDMMIFHLLANKAEKIVKTSEKLYFYYSTRPDNISNSKKGKFKGTICRALAFKDRYIFAENDYPEVKDILLKRAIRFTIGTFSRGRQSEFLNYEDEINSLYEFLSYYRSEIKQSKLVTLIEKISIAIILINPRLFNGISKVLKVD